MTAMCQFCHAIICGPVVTAEASPERLQHAYTQVSLLVSAHMSERHPEEAGREMVAAMSRAGAAVAMRYVELASAAAESERVAAVERLVAAFAPAPVAVFVTLAE